MVIQKASNTIWTPVYMSATENVDEVCLYAYTEGAACSRETMNWMGYLCLHIVTDDSLKQDMHN